MVLFQVREEDEEILKAKGITFTKKGRRYELTPEEVKIIEKELQRRGYTPKTPELRERVF